MEKKKRIIPCLCMTCGVRNDFTNPSGFCQNNHDNWLEYQDVKAKNEFFQIAVIQSQLTEAQFIAKFLDEANTFIDQSNRTTSYFEQCINHLRETYDLEMDALEITEQGRALHQDTLMAAKADGITPVNYIDAIVKKYGIETLGGSLQNEPAN